MTDTDDDFSPTESRDKSDGEKFLNRKAGEYVPKILVQTALLVVLGAAFTIGFSAGAVAASGGSCVLGTINELTNSVSTGAASSVPDDIQSEMVTCTKTSLLSPLPIVVGIVGGLLSAYPAYKMVNAYSSDTYLRSIL